MMIFTVQCDLPTLPGSKMWYLRTYTVMPLLDPEDGEVLDDSMPPYPWTGRSLQQKASNDGSFPGFILVGPIDFTVTPSRRTPGAQINVSMTFGLDHPEEAENELIFEITAPLGYLFQPSCLA